MESFSRVIGGKPVIIRTLASHHAMAQDVFDVIERLSAAAPVHDGLRVRFGWSMLTVRKEGAGWIVCEPDFDGEPLRNLRPQIATTLDVAGKQAAFARAYGIQPVDAMFDQYLVVTRGALASRELQLFREASNAPDDSGWSLTPADAPPASESDESHEAIRVHTLLPQRPAILPVLVLPPGCIVLMNGASVGLVMDEAGQPLFANRGARPGGTGE